MNIYDLFDSYRRQHATEFRRLMEYVAKAVLDATESIPEEYALEVFKTSGDRKWLYCYEDEDEGFLLFEFDGEAKCQYPYDDTAAKTLDRFMRTYYPNITCRRAYTLNLDDKTFELNFEFDIDYEEVEDVEEVGLAVLNSMDLFNSDVAEILKHKLEWSELRKYYKDETYYEYGAAIVSIEC